jgi:hypothetical protein
MLLTNNNLEAPSPEIHPPAFGMAVANQQHLASSEHQQR